MNFRKRCKFANLILFKVWSLYPCPYSSISLSWSLKLYRRTSRTESRREIYFGKHIVGVVPYRNKYCHKCNFHRPLDLALQPFVGQTKNHLTSEVRRSYEVKQTESASSPVTSNKWGGGSCSDDTVCSLDWFHTF